jgi:hypothetical protein
MGALAVFNESDGFMGYLGYDGTVSEHAQVLIHEMGHLDTPLRIFPPHRFGVHPGKKSERFAAYPDDGNLINGQFILEEEGRVVFVNDAFPDGRASFCMDWGDDEIVYVYTTSQVPDRLECQEIKLRFGPPSYDMAWNYCLSSEKEVSSDKFAPLVAYSRVTNERIGFVGYDGWIALEPAVTLLDNGYLARPGFPPWHFGIPFSNGFSAQPFRVYPPAGLLDHMFSVDQEQRLVFKNEEFETPERIAQFCLGPGSVVVVIIRHPPPFMCEPIVIRREATLDVKHKDQRCSQSSSARMKQQKNTENDAFAASQSRVGVLTAYSKERGYRVGYVGPYGRIVGEPNSFILGDGTLAPTNQPFLHFGVPLANSLAWQPFSVHLPAGLLDHDFLVDQKGNIVFRNEEFPTQGHVAEFCYNPFMKEVIVVTSVKRPVFECEPIDIRFDIEGVEDL